MSADKPEPIERHLVYEKIVGERGIWIASADGSNPKLLVAEGEYHEISFPQISPDGTQVAYVGDCGSSHCTNAYVISTSGGKPRRFASGIEGISWSPDSQRIVGVKWSSKELLSVDVATGDEMKLARGDFWGWSFSPDGKQLVFGMSHGSNPEHFNTTNIDLFVTGSDGGNTKRITDTGDAGFPVWGPNAIAFAKLIPHNGWGRHEVWQVQPDGSGRQTITGMLPEPFVIQGCVGVAPLDWSEDGRALLGGWYCEFSDEPMAIDPESGKIRALDWGAYAAGLSRDGRFALVEGGGGAEPSAEEQNVMIVPYAGGKPDVIARGAVAPSWNR
jgi:WD40 repeat protein